MDINKEFKIYDYTTAYSGATLFDMRSFDLTKEQIDNLYDTLENINKGHMPEIFASTLWVTGRLVKEFDWRVTIGAYNRCYEALEQDGFLHASNFMRGEDMLPFILSHMRWPKNHRVCEKNDYMNFQLYDMGVIDKMWTVNPLTLKYYLRIPSTNDSPDYLYLIGGSAELFDDFNPSNNDHVLAYYGYLKYLILARDKLGLNLIYERAGSVETALDINYVIDGMKEQINGILE